MALRPLRPCAHAGCSALTREVYCKKHKPSDKSRRSADAAAWHAWYRLDVWRKDLRPAQLVREPFCRECARRGIRTRATDVDHIQPHRGYWQLFTCSDNLQSLCHACHSRKTAAEIAQITQQKRL